MSVSGAFALHYSWGCTGSYNSSTITFNADGTFTESSSGGSGKWSQTNGNIIWQWNGNLATYGGVVNGGAIVGNMISGSITGAGCFYANKAGAGVAAAEVDHDATGAKKKK
jgi:hypothetical protein